MRRRAALRTCFRQRGRRRRLHARRRARHRFRPRLEERPAARKRAFLHEAHAGACQYFTTVLGPGADVFHYNHIHLDLANHGSTDTGPRRICKPTPAPDLMPAPAAPDGLPPAPEIDEPLDIAHLERAGAAASASGRRLVRTGRRPGRRPAAGADWRNQSLAADPAGRRRSERRSEPDVVDPPPRRLANRPGVALKGRARRLANERLGRHGLTPGNHSTCSSPVRP